MWIGVGRPFKNQRVAFTIIIKIGVPNCLAQRHYKTSHRLSVDVIRAWCLGHTHGPPG